MRGKKAEVVAGERTLFLIIAEATAKQYIFVWCCMWIQLHGTENVAERHKRPALNFNIVFIYQSGMHLSLQ